MTKNKGEKAVGSFRLGFNCAQSVITAFSDYTKLDDSTALALASGFGAGMGSLQDTCGAVTGAFMVFGLHVGHKFDDNAHRKAKSEKLIREFDKRFKEIHGTTSCRKLLQYDLNDREQVKLARENCRFEKVCEQCIKDSIQIVETMLEE